MLKTFLILSTLVITILNSNLAGYTTFLTNKLVRKISNSTVSDIKTSLVAKTFALSSSVSKSLLIADTVLLGGTDGRSAILSPGQSLAPGKSITSPSSKYSLNCQPDGNLVLYDNSGLAYWASDRSDGTISGCVMQTDGNLVIYGNSQAIWASGTAGNPGAFLQVQDDGNVVIYSSMGQPLWTTSTVSVSTLPLGTWRAAAPSTSTSSPSAPCNNNVMDEYDFATNRKVSRRGIYSCGGNMTYEEDTGNAIVQGSTIMIKITSSKESTYLGSRQLIDQGPLHPYSVTYKWTLQTNGPAQLAFTPYCPNCLIAQPIYYTKVIK